MAADTGMKLVLTAGGLTLGNEWLQTHQLNWRIPVATVLAAAATSGLGKVSSRGATSIGVMALIVAAATPLNGKSPIQQIAGLVNHPSSVKTKTTAGTRVA